MTIAQNIKAVKEKIPENVRIVAASKYATAEQIKEAFEAGISEFGENKVQDLLQKQQELVSLPIKWHFIGRLQTNKVNKIVGEVELIHSVDSLKLALAINNRALRAGIKQQVLIQVNVSHEESKAGIGPGKCLQISKEIAKLEGIKLKGLMTIAPNTSKTELLEAHFRKSKQLFDSIQKEQGPDFKWLSMGMSNDFEFAVQSGANILRLGSVLFKGDS